MQIDFVHDTVCPWCRIGKRHLDRAIARWDGDPVVVRYHPFFLQPDLPSGGRDFRMHMSAIKGDANLEPLFAHVRAAGEACDLRFDFDKVGMAPNTLRSHCLIAWAPTERQGEVVDALHQAYFEDGRDIGSIEVLVAIAAEQGLDAEAARAALANDELRANVADRAEDAQEQGISGVPFFVFANAVALSGAQQTAQILAAMRQASGALAGVR